MQIEPSAQASKETGRVESFSDGVFSIAITLLILEIPIHHVSAPGGLLQELGAQWPGYLGYTISFATILIIWINHHNFFRLVRRVDHTFLLLNGLVLLMVTFINYPTAVLTNSLSGADLKNLLYSWGANPGTLVSNQGIAVIFYSATFVLMSLAFNLLWRYTRSRKDLLIQRVDPQIISTINRQYRFSPLYYMPAVVLGFFSVTASLALNALLAISFFFVTPVSID